MMFSCEQYYNIAILLLFFMENNEEKWKTKLYSTIFENSMGKFPGIP